MDITVNLELIATQDYKELLLLELAQRDSEIKTFTAIYNKDKSDVFLREFLNESIRVFNSELKHYRKLFPKVKS